MNNENVVSPSKELITVADGVAILNAETAAALYELEKMEKYIDGIKKAMKSKILAEMERKNIIGIDTDDLTIRYVEEHYRENFNKCAMKKEHADLYDQYVSMGTVAASLRIKLKDNKNDE